MSDATITPEQADKMIHALKTAVDDRRYNFTEEPMLSAKVSYLTTEYCGAMPLSALKKFVDDALEKGMPEDSEVWNVGDASGRYPVEGLVFIYETERVDKIECGDHIPPDSASDLIINTHGCLIAELRDPSRSDWPTTAGADPQLDDLDDLCPHCGATKGVCGDA